MNVSEEAAAASVGMLKEAAVELSKKAMEVTKELLAMMLLKAGERGARDKALAGAKNTVKNLLSAGNNLNAPMTIDKEDAQRVHRLAKEHQIPLAILHGKEGTRVFFRDVDLGRVSEMMKELLSQKITKDNLKQITMSKEDASFFKTRAKRIDIPVNYFKDGENVKISFKDTDIDKVKAIITDIEEEKKKIPLRQMKMDRFKDTLHSKATQTATLRIYDKELNKSIRLALPVTKRAFIQAIRANFGYSYKEAQDIASRVKSGVEKNMILTGLKGSFEWKPDIKSLSANINKLESNISFPKDPDTIKGFSFSTLQLADAAQSKMLTIMHKESGQSLSTLPTTSKELHEELVNRFGIDSKTANELVAKAYKLEFTTDEISKSRNTLDQFEIRKSTNAQSSTLTLGEQSVKISLADKEASVLSIQKTFGIDKRKSTALFNRAVKHQIKDTVKSASQKALSSSVEQVTRSISQSKGAR